MNTTVIDRARGVGKVRKLRVRSASRRGSLVRRFRNFIELSDWDEDLLRRSREIDAFCWMLAVGAAELMVPVSFLVMKG